jgi:aminopeptidase-like protein/aminoglycoside N3'-acetyltransferase
MHRTTFDYTQAELDAALRRVGVGAGATVFVQASLDRTGRPQGWSGGLDAAGLLLDTVVQSIGVEGTLLVPSYTFSFCRREAFDVEQTPAVAGPWNESLDWLERVRLRPDAVRSVEPIHSVTGVGPSASQLLGDVPPTCFGVGSIQHRLVEAGALICLIGVGLDEASLVHHAEEMVGVPYRYRKLFTGRIREGGRLRKAGWLYTVRILAENGALDGARAARRAREAGICRVARLGTGEVVCVRADEYFEWLAREITRDRWFVARGPAGDPVALEAARVPPRRYDVALPARPTMRDVVDGLWQLPRHIVSDAYDAALGALTARFPMAVHEYPTGTECWSWIVPEKWSCEEAWLETADGRRLFSAAEHPLHVVSYSLPFEGIVSRATLFEHLHTHPALPDAVPFIFKYYDGEWGLCCSARLKETLTDDAYRVVIRSRFSYGTLKVGEMVLPGTSDESIVLCAHLCHPAMANDDLAGLAVGLEVMSRLQRLPRRRYTYRLLIVPETIGSVAWLSHHETLIPQLRGGLFLEMLGLDYPHALQLSFDGDTAIDRCCRLALAACDPNGWTGACRTVVGNDERQFNAPGVRVPMLSLSRVLPAGSPCLYYPEYHSSLDTAQLVSDHRLEESCRLVLEMIGNIEADAVPFNRFKGEVCCSRYGLDLDWSADRDGTQRLFDVMDQIDGTRAISSIALARGIPFASVHRIVDALARQGLVDLHHPTDPASHARRLV